MNSIKKFPRIKLSIVYKKRKKERKKEYWLVIENSSRDSGEGNDYVTNLVKPRVKLQIEEKSVTRRDDHVQGGFRRCGMGGKQILLLDLPVTLLLNRQCLFRVR